MTPDIDCGVPNVTIAGPGAQGNGAVEIAVKGDSAVVATISAAPDKEIAIPIPNLRLWSPANSLLDTLVRDAEARGPTVDSYFGMRKM
jgi:hypothetical protein